ncbi:SIMPL domain-containing protein [Allokutzneria oryzae]|uniref:SIMPL domain-containing protein n=1 Tax=Allokutzneria oryzae TaxID=1378989 RepID=A0ABV6A0V0_9PSEU
MAEVVTKGTGEVERIADRAQLWVSYSANGQDRTAAVNELTSRISRVEPLLDREGVEVRSRRLSVHTNWENGQRVGSGAEQYYSVRVTDREQLDELLGALIAAEPAWLNGPDWELSDRTEAVAEAQHHAVEDARRRAQGYAAALGVRLGPLLRITDGNDSYGGSVERMAYGATSVASFTPDTRELKLEPQPVTVSVQCTTTWVLLE